MFGVLWILISFHKLIKTVNTTDIFWWSRFFSIKQGWKTKIIIINNFLKRDRKIPVITKIVVILNYLIFLKVIINLEPARFSNVNFQSVLRLLFKLQHLWRHRL